MDVALLIARVIIALVFILAGLGKLADLAGSRKAVADFGVPEALANPFGVLLPLAELAVALALIPTATAWWGGLGALGLLLLFIAGMSLNLARGRAPDCHCFGQLHSEPVGRQTLIRNVFLALVAAFIVAPGPGHSGLDVTSWLGKLTGPEQIGLVAAISVAVVLIAGAVLAWQLVRGTARLRARLASIEERVATGGGAAEPVVQPGLPVGSQAPGFRLRNLDRTTVSLESLRTEEAAVMLLFVDPNCGPCNALMPDVARWQSEYDPAVRFALISTGSARENRAKANAHEVKSILLQKKFEVANAYGVSGTPSAVLIHPSGTIGSPLAAGPDQIRALLDQYVELLASQAGVTLTDEGEFARAMRQTAESLELGKPAPDLEFVGLAGQKIRLREFRGRDTVLLFWGTSCSFCYEMIPDLREWELQRPDGVPDLVFVLGASPEGQRPMRFQSPVVVDEDSAASRALHANGTPSAVLIDAQGNIASQPVVGAVPILELLGWTYSEDTRASA